MKISGRLALAMVLLAVATSGMVGAFAWFLVADAVSSAVLISLLAAALAGGAIAAVLAIVLAAFIDHRLLKPALSAVAEAEDGAGAGVSDADRQREDGAGRHRRGVRRLRSDRWVLRRPELEPARSGVDGVDARGSRWPQCGEAAVSGISVGGHRQWVDRFLSEVKGDAAGGRYETPLLRKDGHEFFAEVSLTALRRARVSSSTPSSATSPKSAPRKNS
jgi:hypothetical protein